VKFIESLLEVSEQCISSINIWVISFDLGFVFSGASSPFKKIKIN